MTAIHAAPAVDDGQEPWLAHYPVTFFAVVMGLSGLTLATHRMEHALGLGTTAGHVLTAIAIAAFLTIAGVYLAKALRHPNALRAEWNHPIRIAFFPAITIGALLISAALLPWNRDVAQMVWVPATALHLVLTLSVVSAWVSHRPFETAHLTPAWFIPAVGNVLVPLAGVRLGHVEVSWFFFSMGLIFWLVLLTLVFNRLIFHNPIPQRLLPTLVILIAPPSVSFIAWLQLNGGEIDPLARILFYGAVLFVLVTLTQVGKLIRLPFAMSWWAYSFPVAAFSVAALLYGERTGHGLASLLGMIAYALLWGVIVLLVSRTLIGLRRNEICRPES